MIITPGRWGRRLGLVVKYYVDNPEKFWCADEWMHDNNDVIAAVVGRHDGDSIEDYWRCYAMRYITDRARDDPSLARMLMHTNPRAVARMSNRVRADITLITDWIQSVGMYCPDFDVFRWVGPAVGRRHIAPIGVRGVIARAPSCTGP